MFSDNIDNHKAPTWTLASGASRCSQRRAVEVDMKLFSGGGSCWTPAPLPACLDAVLAGWLAGFSYVAGVERWRWRLLRTTAWLFSPSPSSPPVSPSRGTEFRASTKHFLTGRRLTFHTYTFLRRFKDDVGICVSRLVWTRRFLV